MRHWALLVASVGLLPSLTAAPAKPTVGPGRTDLMDLAVPVVLEQAKEEGAKAPGVQAAVRQRVQIKIDHGSFTRAVITEPTLELKVEVYRDLGDNFSFQGDLKARGFLRNPRYGTLYGVDIMGGGVNVSISPSGGSFYVLNGFYQKSGDDKAVAEKGDSLHLLIHAYPTRDFAVHDSAKGIDLDIRWKAFGYAIDGTVDPEKFGKRELAILAGAISALTDDYFHSGPIRRQP